MIKKYQFESEPAEGMTLRQIALWAAFPACAALVLAGGIALNMDRAPQAEPLVEVASAAEAPAAAIVPAPAVAKADRPVESAPSATAEATPQPLDEADPRWGGDVTAAAGSSQEETAFGAQGDAGPLPTDATDDLDVALAEAAIDEDTTSAIGTPQSNQGSEVIVAESEQEVAALEQAVAVRQDQLPDAAFVAETDDALAAIDAQAGATTGQVGGTADTSSYVAGQTTEYVNFRTGPSNDAETISIVPGGTPLQGQPMTECPHFCAVEIDGRQGYIYKAFIDYAAPEADTDTARVE
ncbi:hypothetical protein [Rhizobium sp. EC-SD404]|uniref:hypothetical protein n=1 Tax=Rhizobium sp. EC-SD404 TaxID=2038389 RepID=UPI001255D599|nr:hypothetical protein [Rhizobium sp. EC-SD404]VVT31001.1 hypothetical protein RHIZ404_230224 [Rhizobium sp. EC-SD404]